VRARQQAVYYEGESANVSYLIENLMTGYDKRLRPNYKGIQYAQFYYLSLGNFLKLILYDD